MNKDLADAIFRKALIANFLMVILVFIVGAITWFFVNINIAQIEDYPANVMFTSLALTPSSFILSLSSLYVSVVMTSDKGIIDANGFSISMCSYSLYALSSSVWFFLGGFSFVFYIATDSMFSLSLGVSLFSMGITLFI